MWQISNIVLDQLVHGYTQKNNHPMMTLASLGECADPTVSAPVKEILAQEIDHTRGWRVIDGCNRGKNE